jgi:NADPH:quinone reductase-like Zn-dependent oxidoreductase
MMGKRVVVHHPGSFEKLKVEPFKVTFPKNHEVLIRCEACGVNFADVCVRMGIYSSAKKYVGWPITPGFEVAGVIEACGPEASKFAVGERVIVLTRFGGYTSHLTLDEEQVFPLPKNWSFAEGAAFPTVFLTAWYALQELAHPHPKDTLLVHSAAGGVGGALIQIGKALGCRVIAVVGESSKIDYALALGADEVIDKSKEPLWKMAEKFAPDGYDVILDANGAETLKQSYLHLAPAGKLVVYGFHTMLSKGRGTPNWLKLIWDWFWIPRFNPLTMTGENKSVMAFNLSYLFKKRDRLNKGLDELSRWVAEGKVRPLKVTSYPLEEVQQAHRALESGKTIGKLVLTVENSSK